MPRNMSADNERITAAAGVPDWDKNSNSELLTCHVGEASQPKGDIKQYRPYSVPDWD